MWMCNKFQNKQTSRRSGAPLALASNGSRQGEVKWVNKNEECPLIDIIRCALRTYTHLQIHTHTRKQTTWQAVEMESRMDFHLAFPLRPYFICAVSLSYGRDCKTFVIRHVHSRYPHIWQLHSVLTRSLAFLLNIKMSGTFTIIGLLIIIKYIMKARHAFTYNASYIQTALILCWLAENSISILFHL